MLDQFARQNRWWLDPASVERDRHLRQLAQAPIRWEPPLPFRFDRDGIYTLRGPRQVGKSTILKRQIADLLADGWPAGYILYLDVELAGLESARDLVEAIRSYLDSLDSWLNAGPTGVSERVAIFLDEVTRVRDWAGAIRGLVDNDELLDVTLIATGSHTTDLRRGGERLPGRRGGGQELDLECLPLSFREYVAVSEPGLLLPPTVTTFTRDPLRASRHDRALLRSRLTPLLERYLLSGGFLTTLNDLARHGQVTAESFQAYREAIAGEFTRAGLREAYLRELIDWLGQHLGQELDYRGIAADTDIGSKDTARNYLDHLVEVYAAVLMHRTTSITAPGPAFRSPKKVHPIDPLFWHLIRAWAASDPDPWPAAVETMTRPEEVGHIVESVVSVHMQRAFGDRVYFWRTSDGREIDIVIASREPRRTESPDINAQLAEVKYQRQVDARDARALISAGGGVLVTRSFDGDLADDAVYALPVADALLLLDAPALAPARR
jgi:predicted AAA+ superfamily ATPase